MRCLETSSSMAGRLCSRILLVVLFRKKRRNTGGTEGTVPGIKMSVSIMVGWCLSDPSYYEVNAHHVHGVSGDEVIVA